MKTNPVKRKTRTYFEQIPIDVVKKITFVKEPKKKPAVPKQLAVEAPERKTEPYSMPLSSLCWTGH